VEKVVWAPRSIRSPFLLKAPLSLWTLFEGSNKVVGSDFMLINALPKITGITQGISAPIALK
jgi:hypothetical protein